MLGSKGAVSRSFPSDPWSNEGRMRKVLADLGATFAVGGGREVSSPAPIFPQHPHCLPQPLYNLGEQDPH